MPSPCSLPELQAAVWAFMAANFPGLTPKRVRILTHEGEPLSFPVRGCLTAPPAPPPAAAEEAGSFSQCCVDILEALEKVGHRMTTTRLLSEMAKRGKEWSDRTVSRWLAQMVADGTLTNNQAARPRGYGLPEWDAPGDAPPEGP